MRSFLGFGQVEYIGQPQPFPIKLGGIAGKHIPLLFQWLSYGASTSQPNINVLVDVDTGLCKSFDQIRSVYIDNLGSPNPVYVFFPDSNYCISAKANSEGWYPALTNAKKVWVVGEGFLTGQIPQTAISLSNLPSIPAVNTEIDQSASLFLASPTIARGTSIYNTSLGSPALADQFFLSDLLDVGTLGSIVPIWNTPYGNGFLYINSLFLNCPAFGGPVPGLSSFTVSIESTGVAGVLATPSNESTNGVGFSSLNFFAGANIKLDATQSWQARVTVANNVQGHVQISSTFTQQ